MSEGTGVAVWGVVVLLVCFCRGLVTAETLRVNIRNGGGEVIQETIAADVKDDAVNLTFTKSDGTQITQHIDFRSQLQIFKVLLLGEEERGGPPYQYLCLVTKFLNNEFINSDAMSKLRQKNPRAIRTPEDDKGHEEHIQDFQLDVALADKSVSPFIERVCGDARDSTYARESDLKNVARFTNRNYVAMMGAGRAWSMNQHARCKDTPDVREPCICQYEICIGWYPCGLKYCKGKDSTNKIVSYRCGIKTCKKCRVFEFVVKEKLNCLWDE